MTIVNLPKNVCFQQFVKLSTSVATQFEVFYSMFYYNLNQRWVNPRSAYISHDLHPHLVPGVIVVYLKEIMFHGYC